MATQPVPFVVAPAPIWTVVDVSEKLKVLPRAATLRRQRPRAISGVRALLNVALLLRRAAAIGKGYARSSKGIS